MKSASRTREVRRNIVFGNLALEPVSEITIVDKANDNLVLPTMSDQAEIIQTTYDSVLTVDILQPAPLLTVQAKDNTATIILLFMALAVFHSKVHVATEVTRHTKSTEVVILADLTFHQDLLLFIQYPVLGTSILHLRAPAFVVLYLVGLLHIGPWALAGPAPTEVLAVTIIVGMTFDQGSTGDPALFW